MTACGECFSYAYDRLRQDGGTLVQATVHDPWSGKPYVHAWVENRGRVYDWQSMIAKLGRPLSVRAFWKQYKPTDVRRFDATQAAVRALKHKHYGPWLKKAGLSEALSGPAHGAGQKCARVVNPKASFDPRSFRTLLRGNSRVLIGCPTGQWMPRKKRCHVGTRVYEVITPRPCKR